MDDSAPVGAFYRAKCSNHLRTRRRRVAAAAAAAAQHPTTAALNGDDDDDVMLSCFVPEEALKCGTHQIFVRISLT
jgi:hypothetical protein